MLYHPLTAASSHMILHWGDLHYRCGAIQFFFSLMAESHTALHHVLYIVSIIPSAVFRARVCEQNSPATLRSRLDGGNVLHGRHNDERQLTSILPRCTLLIVALDAFEHLQIHLTCWADAYSTKLYLYRICSCKTAGTSMASTTKER